MWAKIKLPRVKEYYRFKVIDIPDAASLFIDSLDFAVDPLGDSIGLFFERTIIVEEYRHRSMKDVNWSLIVFVGWIRANYEA